MSYLVEINFQKIYLFFPKCKTFFWVFLVVATPPLFFPSCSGHSLSQKFNFIIINTKTITKTWTFFNCVVKIVNHHISHQFSFIHYCASVRNEWNISLDNFIKHISTTYISEECKSIIKYHFRFKKKMLNEWRHVTAWPDWKNFFFKMRRLLA